MQQGIVPGAFIAVVNGALLQQYAQKFKVMLIVTAPLAGEDPITNINLVKSGVYTIIDGPISIATLGTVFPDKRFAPNVIFYNIAIYPGDLTPNNIGNIADVTRLGGKIVATGTHAGAFLQMPPQVPPVRSN